MTKKEINKILKEPDEIIYTAHNKLFKIVRKVWDLDHYITYRIYEKRKFLFFRYWSSITIDCSYVSVKSVNKAKKWINNEYLLLSKLEPSVDCD